MTRIATALMLLMSAGASAQPSTVEGAWVVVVSCPPAADAAGYTMRFGATIASGLLEAEHGSPGSPGFLHLTGRLGPDATGTITADGLIGSSRVAIGHLPESTPYHYLALARFNPTHGTATRTTTRPCTLDFTRPQ